MGLCASNDAKPAEDEGSPKPFSDLAQQQANGAGGGASGASNKQSARYGAGSAAASSSSSSSGPAATQLGTAATDIVFSVCAGGWDEATGLPEFFCGSEDKSFAQFNASRVVQRVPDAHSRCISDLSYSLPDRKLYSASRDKTIRSWSAAQGGCQWKLASTLTGHTLPITCLEICASNPARLVSGGRDYQLRLWDTETNACMRWTEVQQNIITDVAWLHGQDDLVLQASEDLTLRLWDLRTKSEAQSFSDGPYFALHCGVSADNNYFLTAHNGFEGVGCELKVFDRRSGGKCVEVQVASQAVTDAAFVDVASSQNLYAATASKDGSLKLWDVSAIMTAGDAVALSDQPCSVGLIAEANFDVGQESVQSLASANAAPAGLAAARKGKASLATGHVNGRVSVWDIDVHAKQMQLRAQSPGSQQ